MTLTPEQQTFVNDLDARRMQAFHDAPLGISTIDHLQALSEVTTHEDVSRLNAIVRSMPEDVRSLIYLYEDVWSEFVRGWRCGVCGMTAAQSKAINYDCAREC